MPFIALKESVPVEIEVPQATVLATKLLLVAAELFLLTRIVVA